jgi:hypothetical protein
VYLFELMELMRSNGHEVALFSMADERGEPTPYDRHFVPHIDFKGPLSWRQKVLGAAHVIYSTDARRRIRAMIEEFRPHVATVIHTSLSTLHALTRRYDLVHYHARHSGMGVAAFRIHGVPGKVLAREGMSAAGRGL